MNISFLDPSQQFNNAILSACLAWLLISFGDVEQIADFKIILSDEATYMKAVF